MTPCIESPRTPSSRYPRVWNGGRSVRENRFVWEQQNGPIPDGMVVCHHCDNPRCVRLDHLFLGTHSENMLDAIAKGRHRQTRKTHCPSGHPYDDANTYRSPGRPGSRNCRACKAQYARDRRAKAAEPCTYCGIIGGHNGNCPVIS